ncbi:hypothetical protein GCM10009547_02280 [Sporichthya brevicatena]|uniref:Uncharacterized protein n=1 Tax=Sporichthya brevicatena TaxID=171442 RepID=A0ABN1G4U7_9ACTN
MRTPTLFTTGVVLAAFLIPAAAEAAPTAAEATGISKTKARKIVNAGVVKKTDVKGFTAEKYVADPADGGIEKALYKCLGGKAPKEVLSKDGPTLSKGAYTIDSGATVIATVKAARADAKLAQSEKAPRCLKRAMTTSVERDGGVVQRIKVKAIKIAVPGADVAFGYAYEFIVTHEDIAFLIVGYDLNALVGQTQLNVGPARYDGGDPNLKQALALLAKNVKRVRAVR